MRFARRRSRPAGADARRGGQPRPGPLLLVLVVVRAGEPARSSLVWSRSWVLRASVTPSLVSRIRPSSARPPRRAIDDGCARGACEDRRAPPQKGRRGHSSRGQGKRTRISNCRPRSGPARSLRRGSAASLRRIDHEQAASHSPRPGPPATAAAQPAPPQACSLTKKVKIAPYFHTIGKPTSAPPCPPTAVIGSADLKPLAASPDPRHHA
jgi:hypothetical protein